MKNFSYLALKQDFCSFLNIKKWFIRTIMWPLIKDNVWKLLFQLSSETKCKDKKNGRQVYLSFVIARKRTAWIDRAFPYVFNKLKKKYEDENVAMNASNKFFADFRLLSSNKIVFNRSDAAAYSEPWISNIYDGAFAKIVWLLAVNQICKTLHLRCSARF